MIKIEVTGSSIGEVADKLLAIGNSLQTGTATFKYEGPLTGEALPIANGGTGATPRDEVFNGDPIMPEVAEAAAVDPTPAPKSAPIVEITESQQTTPEPSSTHAPAASASEPLNFDKDVAPVVLAAVRDHGKPWVQEVLSQFGFERASQVPVEQLPELVEVLSAGPQG